MLVKLEISSSNHPYINNHLSEEWADSEFNIATDSITYVDTCAHSPN